MSPLGVVLAAFVGVVAGLLFAALCVRLFGRWFTRVVLGRFVRRLLTDHYHENLWEFVTATWRYGAQTIVETGLRAASGQMIIRPFGRMRPFPGPGFDRLMFVPAQLDRLPTPDDVQIGTTVVIGPRATRPLHLEIPLLVTAMGYGSALSKQTKIVLARATARVGTATNTGEGPFLEEERREARLLVVQYVRGSWNKEPKILRQADMIEIQLGQGAEAGAERRIPASHLGTEVARLMGVKQPQGAAVIHSRLQGVEGAQDLALLVAELRDLTGGVPVGVKIAAGDRLERDIDALIAADVDFITLDGAEAGTHGALPITADDFGVPTFVALCRAVRHLDGIDIPARPSLIVSGGLFTPGEFLKALALGADAVAIGTAALYSLGKQSFEALPWEPPLDLVWHRRPASKRLDVKAATDSLERFFRACVQEMQSAAQALGKTALTAVDRGDLAALDPETAELARVRLCTQPLPASAPRGGVAGPEPNQTRSGSGVSIASLGPAGAARSAVISGQRGTGRVAAATAGAADVGLDGDIGGGGGGDGGDGGGDGGGKGGAVGGAGGIAGTGRVGEPRPPLALLARLTVQLCECLGALKSALEGVLASVEDRAAPGRE